MKQQPMRAASLGIHSLASSLCTTEFDSCHRQSAADTSVYLSGLISLLAGFARRWFENSTPIGISPTRQSGIVAMYGQARC